MRDTIREMHAHELRSAPTPQVGLQPNEIADRATDAFRQMCRKFAATGEPVNFDFREHCLQWTSRGDHFTHRLHRYPGRLTPYVPLFFLAVRDVASANGRLLDPFAGCGTVLVEAPVHPAHPMLPVGLEINPLARLIAKVKTTPLDARRAEATWKRILARHSADTSRAGLRPFPNKRHWFTPAVEGRLARALRAITVVRDPGMLDFFLVALSSVVRHVALADPSVSVPVALDPTRFRDPKRRAAVRERLKERQDADVLALLDLAVRNNLARLRAWTEARTVKVNNAVVGADARSFATARYVRRGELALEAGEAVSDVSLVLTSPPYANAQRYTRSLRLEMFVLGFTSNGQDERRLDELQVGTERVRERQWAAMVEPMMIASADRVVARVKKQDMFRAAIIGKYVRDIKSVIENCFAALKFGSHAVFVVGNNRVCGSVLDNAKILSEIGEQVGFEQVLRVRNRIPSRGLLTKRHHTAGVITHEQVLVMRKPLSTAGA